MKPGELLSRIVWRLGPILLIVWAVRSGAIDYKKYVRMFRGETKTPAQIQIDTVSKMLVEEFAREHHLPDQYRLAYWLTQNPQAIKSLGPSPHVDPFGTPLRLTKIPDGFILESDGPDRKPKTPDDVTKKVEGLEKLALQAP